MKLAALVERFVPAIRKPAPTKPKRVAAPCSLGKSPLGAAALFSMARFAWLPTDPIYGQFDIPLFERALTEAWAEPARRFPYFGRLGAK